MKKLIPLAAAALILASCGNTSTVDSILAKDASASSTDTSSAAENDVSLNAIDSAVIADAEKLASGYWADNNRSATSAPEQVDLDALDLSDGEIDIDLTKLTPNLVYAQVFDMVNSPEKYLGKKVRTAGTFSFTHDAVTNGDYYAVFIADAAACCQQGMEFVLTGEHKYPDDYPEIGAAITIEGEFNTYTENGWKYCQLKNATMTVA